MKILMSPRIPATKALAITTAEDAHAARQAREQAEQAAQESAKRAMAIHQQCARESLRAYNLKKPELLALIGTQDLFVDTRLGLLATARIMNGEAYLAFRGTIGPFGLSRNWLKVNFAAGRVGYPFRHGGFQRAWKALKPQVMRWLTIHQPTALHVTGHSMGAALAHLAALDLHGDWPVHQVVLFAPPMVGSPGLNAQYSQAIVKATQRPLHETTQRYLLLSDAISIPLPRLLGYEPSLPVFCIDQMGGRAGRVPGFVEQAIDQLSGNAPDTSTSGYLLTRGLARRNADLGGPTALERAMPTLRLFALSYGAGLGWFAMAMLSVANVMRRAVGFHSMALYANALRALPPHSTDVFVTPRTPGTPT